MLRRSPSTTFVVTWKTDFLNDDRIEMEIKISTLGDVAMACNIVAPEFGFEIDQVQVVEILVAEEHIPRNGFRQISTHQCGTHPPRAVLCRNN
ncbi:hypothetical protein LIPSTDRAFT_106233 [Lipomyces starkeyi NRRL Y-11557]|uniref:Uncharacterized protein n=1 Tax=Lipomyces starkeyi NRRL Y-11557 TaxID=675824 RepID=A0A1E3PZZ9_LIPST|nr:hypothetical protein LIPSTDRAFT_106233 [Lipomyces starkeyi NRRL Y-11557]